MNIQTIIDQSRIQLREEPRVPPTLVVYKMLDYEVVKNSPFYQLAWQLAHDDNCSKSDALGFFRLLELYIQEKECQKQS
jgi:hypothetical protein